jgi:hypothetical protein
VLADCFLGLILPDAEHGFKYAIKLLDTGWKDPAGVYLQYMICCSISLVALQVQVQTPSHYECESQRKRNIHIAILLEQVLPVFQDQRQHRVPIKSGRQYAISWLKTISTNKPIFPDIPTSIKKDFSFYSLRL